MFEDPKLMGAFWWKFYNKTVNSIDYAFDEQVLIFLEIMLFIRYPNNLIQSRVYDLAKSKVFTSGDADEQDNYFNTHLNMLWKNIRPVDKNVLLNP